MEWSPAGRGPSQVAGDCPAQGLQSQELRQVLSTKEHIRRLHAAVIGVTFRRLDRSQFPQRVVEAPRALGVVAIDPSYGSLPDYY